MDSYPILILSMEEPQISPIEIIDSFVGELELQDQSYVLTGCLSN